VLLNPGVIILAAPGRCMVAKKFRLDGYKPLSALPMSFVAL
jgi:hypothetical protein